MKVAPLAVLAGALVGTAPVARASSAETRNVTEGTLETREAGKTVPVPLAHTDVKAAVEGFFAQVTVEQTFVNPYAKKIEAIYLFPLPSNAAVNEMEIATSKRTIRAEIKLRDEAKKIYQAARRAGHVAALLSQERPNLFTQAVANIEPGATVLVRLRYVQTLAYDHGAYELVYPMVAGPRHVPATSAMTREAAAAVQPPVLPAGMRPASDISLSVDIDAGLPIRRLSSPSHAIETSEPGAGRAVVSIARRDSIPSKDFILRYEVAGAAPQFAVVPHREAGADGAFFLMAQPPDDAVADQVTAKEMVFVIDTSSSMAGRPLDKAREAVRRALRGMHPDDTFQVIRFDDRASALGDRPIANKPGNVRRALSWLDAIRAVGGTDMSAGIRAALEFPHDPARLRIVVFLTDGYIGNEDEVLALVQERLGPSRLFSFGVGSAVNRYLLEQMAELGRGTVQIVRPDEDTAGAVERFHERIASPVLTDVEIDWKGLAVSGVTPARVPDLFAGQPIALHGRYARGGRATIAIRGRMAGRRVSFDVPVEFPDVRERPAVAVAWARARIAELSRGQLRGEKEEVVQEIIRLALAHRLVTRYTSFVAVDASRTTSGGEAEAVAVPVDIPDGVQAPRPYAGGGVEGGVSGGVLGGVGGGFGAGVSATLESESAGDDRARDVARPSSAPEPARAMAAAPPPALDMTRLPMHAAKTRVRSSPDPAPPRTGVAAMRAAARKCYVAGHPPPGASIEVSVGFDDSGSVSNIAVKGAEASVTACITAVARKWRAAPASRATLKLSP